MPEETTKSITLRFADPDQDPKVTQELAIVTSAIEVSLGVKELTTAFAARRDELTATVYGFVRPPTNDEEQANILSAQRAVAKLRTDLTKNASALKSPLNAARSRIIDLEDSAVQFLKKAETHAQSLINAYQQKLADARRAEELRVQREREETERQRQQAQRETEEAERKRQQAEIARQRAEEANSPAAKLKAQQDQKRLEDEAAKLEADAYEKDLAAAMAPPAPAPISAPEPQARTVYDFTVNGRNEFEKGASLAALYKQHPEFFNHTVKEEAPREFTIKLKVKDLLDALAGNAPFAKLESANGITISTRLSTLR